MRNTDKQDSYVDQHALTKYKIAVQTIILTFSLVFTNGQIIPTVDWASPLIQSIIIICVPIMYYVTMLIVKIGYSTNKPRYSFLFIALLLLLGAVNFLLFMITVNLIGIRHYIINGVMQDVILPLILSIFFIYLGLIWLIYNFAHKLHNTEYPAYKYTY